MYTVDLWWSLNVLYQSYNSHWIPRNIILLSRILVPWLPRGNGKKRSVNNVSVVHTWALYSDGKPRLVSRRLKAVFSLSWSRPWPSLSRSWSWSCPYCLGLVPRQFKSPDDWQDASLMTHCQCNYQLVDVLRFVTKFTFIRFGHLFSHSITFRWSKRRVRDAKMALRL